MEQAKIPMNKVYLKHSKGVVWTGLLAIFIAGLFAAFYLLPVFAYFPNGGGRVDVSGVDFICYSIRVFVKVVYNPNLDRFDSSVSSYAGYNPLFTFIATSHNPIEIVLSGFLILGTVFAIIIMVLGLQFLIKGHRKNTIIISALSHSAVSFLSFYVSLLFIYLLLCRKMFIECNILEHVRFYMTPFAIIIVATVFAIILSVIYSKCFKKRVYIKDYKPKAKDDPTKCSELIRKYIENFPKGTTQIGDFSFDNNEEITEALIPEGFTLLGQGAFSNCPNLETVTIPSTIEEIGQDCFKNTPNLKVFNFRGTTHQWKQVYKGTFWIEFSGLKYIQTSDGTVDFDGNPVEVEPEPEETPAEQPTEEPKEEVKEEAPKTEQPEVKETKPEAPAPQEQPTQK